MYIFHENKNLLIRYCNKYQERNGIGYVLFVFAMGFIIVLFLLY